MLNANSKGTFVLFNRIKKDDDDKSKTYPIMTGYVETDKVKMQVAAFLQENKETKVKFLSLSISQEGIESKFTGNLNKETKPGREDHYFGYISEQFEETVKDAKSNFTTSDWQLGISCKVAKAAGSEKKYIRGQIYPLGQETPADGEEAEDLAF